jgi:signal peptidase II
MRKNLPYFLLIIVLIAADQFTKYFILKTLPPGSLRTVIPGFFNLSHVQNRGAIFGFFSRSGSSGVHLILMLASLLALCLVVYYFVKTPASEWLLKATLSLILAGALGNQLDRLFRGYVIDFLDVYIGRHHWPSFNVADSCISIGAVLLIYIFFFKRGSTCTLCS